MTGLFVGLSLACLWLAFMNVSAVPAGENSAPANLPTVDLGYQVHRAIAYNAAVGLYNFSNIRYAAPPTGNNRWRPPVSPAQDRGIIRDGSIGRICPQANPSWIGLATEWIPNYFFGKPLNVTMSEMQALNMTYTLQKEPINDPRTSEDCLFLDVVVPKEIFDSKATKLAPVLVWIHGGGYTAGSKTSEGDASLLVSRAFNHSMEGVVFVPINYRLGAFGWLGSSTLQKDGVSNAGFYDQRFALEWVQKNIHLFGGDCERVTVMGESAGAGSIMHQITAYGGTQKTPFTQAILQSPAWFPVVSDAIQQNTLDGLLALNKVKTLQQLRNLSTEQLIASSFLQIYESPYGTFTYGPVVDKTFAPALPGVLLSQGKFDKSIGVMVGHNSNEGLLFVDPFVQTQVQLQSFVAAAFPTASQTTIDYVTDTLYPAVFDGSHGYHDAIARTALIISESVFSCNTYYLNKAYENQTHAYLFGVPPGVHGEDLVYTFYNGGGANFGTLLLNTTTAVALQDYVVTFAQSGKPSSPDVPGIAPFDVYGSNAMVQDLELSTISRAKDPVANQRCNYWQMAPFDE